MRSAHHQSQRRGAGSKGQIGGGERDEPWDSKWVILGDISKYEIHLCVIEQSNKKWLADAREVVSAPDREHGVEPF